MDLFWDAVLWSAIPVAVLLLACAVGAYWLSHRRPFPMERSQARVERAYLATRDQSAKGVSPDQSEHSARHVSVGT